MKIIKNNQTQKRGRPKGQGPYGEPTQVLRIPLSMVDEVKTLIAGKRLRMPFFSSEIPAGPPSEPTVEVEDYLTASSMLQVDPETCFILKVSGDSMINAGIFNGDYLIVDESQQALHNDIVVASVNGEATVKRLYHQNNIIKLIAENDNYEPIDIPVGSNFLISGVVIRSLRRF